MKKGAKVFWVVAGIVVTQQVWSASSISTRVKVVEEKIKMHDKKLRDLAAQQELTNKQVESLKAVREEAEKAVVAKAEAARQAAIASAKVAAVKAKQRQEVAKQEEAKQSAEEDFTPPAMAQGSRYAFP
jgi:peptidoglycan hydrolase CwlO-like protein